ncbi:MAG: hypothetical protein J0L92_08275 [Deltaproteobacteria bacterium]|nr:hypothetical protein [Deltaproteobacteria bacterium]
MNVTKWIDPVDGKTPATVMSVAHLQEDERAPALGAVLEEALAWTRRLQGTGIVFDEVYGYLPPHPHSSPKKRPLVSLMKQPRAFGVTRPRIAWSAMLVDWAHLAGPS